MRLSFFRWLWTLALHHGWPRPLMLAIERRFLDAGMRETLRRSAAEYRSATADTIPAPGESWACLAGDGPPCAPDSDADLIADLHDAEDWRGNRPQRKAWVA